MKVVQVKLRIPALAWDKLASTDSCPIDFLLAYQLLESSPKNDISMEDIWLNVFELYRSLRLQEMPRNSILARQIVALSNAGMDCIRSSTCRRTLT